MLSIHSIACMAFALGVAYGPGDAGVGCMFALFFFESICYPVCPYLCGRGGQRLTSEHVLTGFSQVIFTLGTKNLGRHTKRGSGLIVMVRPPSPSSHIPRVGIERIHH